MNSLLRDIDLFAWAQQSANLLRQGAELQQGMRDQIAEELDSMAKSTRREMRSRVASLLMHLLKIRYQPDARTRSWDLTVANQRAELEQLLDESPSLRRVLECELHKIYDRARLEARLETGLDIFPQQNPFTLEQILRG